MLLPYEAALAGVTQGVNCMCDLDVSSFISGTSRLRPTDGGELQHSEWEPDHCPRPEHWPCDPGPQRDQHVLLPGLWWCWPHWGRNEGLAQTVRQAGRHLNTPTVFDCNTRWQSCRSIIMGSITQVLYKEIITRLLFLSCVHRSRQRSLRRLKVPFHHKKSRAYMWVCLYYMILYLPVVEYYVDRTALKLLHGVSSTRSNVFVSWHLLCLNLYWITSVHVKYALPCWWFHGWWL